MDWQGRMVAAIDWIEAHLTEDFDVERAAAAANASAFHFMRMFDVITGISPAEYARRRRLTRAAIDLASTDDRIIDVALRYGYDSPDSFARAFKREFNCLPSEARRPGASLHSYPPLSFTVALRGDKPMEFRVERGPALSLTGIATRVRKANGENFIAVPAFWERADADGSFAALCKKATPRRLGVIGVCHEFDCVTGDFTYAIAIERPDDRSGLPERCVDFEVPASTWAKVTSRGPLRANFQDTIKRIYSEWFPSSGREHAGTAEIEYYPDLPDAEAPDYWCEYWVPIR